MQIDPDARIPLGVGKVIQKTFERYFARIWVYLILAGGPAVISAVLSLALAPSPEELVASAIPGFTLSTLVIVIIQTILGAIGTGLVIYAAVDTERQEPARIAGYFGATLANLVPLVVLSLVVSVLGMVALIFLIVPGLYVFAMFAVVVPALLLEGTSWGSMQRSRELTQGYRWPLVGTFILIGLIFVLASTLIGLVAGLASGAQFGAPVGFTLGGFLAELVTTAIFSGLSAVFALTLYLRLKEIREGGGLENLSEVFR